MAMWAGADLIDMEFVQFHPTGMVWPPSVRGILVTEGVRGDGGVLKNTLGDRFMFNYIPDLFRKETAETEEEADRWLKGDRTDARRTPDLLPRDEVARAINSEVKAGRGTPHGGVFLDIASRLNPESIKKRLPSMYHQFKELADVDITKEPMEVGPTCHYVMGGIRVDGDSSAATIPGLFASGESAGGMHGANRLGGNSLSDLLVFGKRSGEFAAKHAQGVSGEPKLNEDQLDDLVRDALAPFERIDGENPYEVHHDLQETMQNLVGIIRTESDLAKALDELQTLKQRASNARITGSRRYNPGWHMCIDLHAMITVSECCAKAALERRESRGGHTREDYPEPSSEFAKVNIACTAGPDGVEIRQEPLSEMPDDLKKIIEEQPS
jgi:succinate dehydrogenase / fumarate reductase flavoprotein subunit